MTQGKSSSILALDVGKKRIGVARADTTARIAAPLTTIDNNDDVLTTITSLVSANNAQGIVVGFPRGLQGQRTAQAAYTEDFVRNLQSVVALPVYWQDESVTSRQAEQELKQRGKPYIKGDIDALAATYILEDFINDKLERRL